MTRPFFRSDHSIGSFPLFLPLAITAFGGPEGYFSLAIIVFGASEFIVPKYYYRLGKWDLRSLDSLIKEVTVFKVWGYSTTFPREKSIRIPIAVVNYFGRLQLGVQQMGA